MGKRIIDMTPDEIIAQRKRAKRNYKRRIPKMNLVDSILFEANKIQNKREGFDAGIKFAINIIKERHKS